MLKIKEMVKKPKLSLVVLASFGVIFALAGIYLVYHSRAAGPIFWNDFNAAPLNSNNWLAVTPWCSHSDVYAQRYTDNNLSFVNTGQENSFRIQTRKETATSGSQTWNYTSGTISSGCRPDIGGTVKKAFSYGYFEMRAKLPKGQGIWPAFWLTNDDPDQAKHHEIDAFEMLGNEPNKIYMTYHLSGRQVYQSTYIGPDFSAGYHTFAVDWQPGYIRWYIDGVKRGEYTGTQLSNQLWITANTDVGTVGSWPGAPDATTVFPQNYDIDYIRAYTTKPDPTSTPTADTIAPTVSIVAPTNGATVSGAVNVTANASDNVGVSKVEFYLDGNLKGTKSSSPYTIGLDSSTLTPGNHTILTKAYDTSNLTAQSQVTVSASTVVAPPTIQITSPADGTTLSNGKNPITVKAVDSYQVTKVSYYLDGKLLTNITTTPFTYYWQTRKVSSGSHLLKAILTDILGRNATSEITVQK